MTEANTADQKEVMVSLLVICVVTSSIAALMTIKKSPALRMTAGRVISLRNEPRKVLINEKIKATKRYDHAPPWTLIPGTKPVAAHTARANTPQRTNILMVKEYRLSF